VELSTVTKMIMEFQRKDQQVEAYSLMASIIELVEV